MSSLENTKIALSNLLSLTKKLLFVTNILVQSIFLAFYVYLICTNFNHLAFLIIYSVLFIITTTNFIRYLITNVKHTKKPKIFYRVVRISKYASNGALLGLNTYEIICFGALALDVIFLLTSAISLFIHVCIELFRLLLEKRLSNLGVTIKNKIAVEKRKEQINVAKNKFYHSVDKPLQSIANSIKQKSDKPLNDTSTPHEITVENQTNIENSLEIENAQVNDQKENSPITTKQKIEMEKKNIAQHFGVIKERFFRKNSNQQAIKQENNNPNNQLEPLKDDQENKLDAINNQQQIDLAQERTPSENKNLSTRLSAIKNKFFKQKND